MTETAIAIRDLGKMYRLYKRPADKVLDAFGVNRWLFWRKQYYQEFWALRGLNLEVKRGERLGLIGRNGAGKSTLLKIITGNIAPTEGTVEVQGRVQALMELGTGFHPEFTGRQNIQASLAYQGLSPAKIRNLEDEIIDFSELDEFIDQPIKTYSAGMYARLAFTVATVIEPEILIIDEVLGAGDAYFAGKCVERMRKLTEDSGATVLFVSHDLGSVQTLCNRVIWINRGTIHADGNPLHAIKFYSAMVRREEEIRLKARDLKLSKKQTLLLENEQDIYQSFLFRFVGKDGGHPDGKHKIRSIVLQSQSENIGHIEVGGPMDNKPGQKHYILDDPGVMDWGSASRDSNGYYRVYANFKGKYAHAPFEFAVPKSYLANSSDLCLQIEADCEQESVAVEVFVSDYKDYHRLGMLASNNSVTQFTLNTEGIGKDNQGQHSIEIKDSLKEINSLLTDTDEYGSKEALITEVLILDSQRKETKTLFCLNPCKVVVKYRTTIAIQNPTFVFCIYLPSGICASQWIASGSELGVDVIAEEGQVVFHVDKLLLGKGAYVASAAIFKYFSINGIEPQAYHLLDRCIHFQVCDPNETDRTDYGICRQPLKVKLHNAGKYQELL
ncbi:ABC transporter ATP-binding protein [Nostoc sp. CHAB 5784]|uniref:ABC transporter ATP-binding protein n=1 Tax=Nostoc mirabile TaxID=2907820 RepID=UPI001E413923|nr:ABC transporter ATP-binding protein [Nostoc mirabile]MCC5664232.1 ABC transporter ATP-binding protein [Nostoc mirabile CHAB5784]